MDHSLGAQITFCLLYTSCDDVKTCVQDKDVIITIVGYPKDVEEVYFGENGIIANAKPGAVLIDMTTTSPKLSERIYACLLYTSRCV